MQVRRVILASILLGLSCAASLEASAWVDLVADLNYDGKIDILDICIMAKAFGSRPSDASWDAMADLNGDGLINIVDICILSRSFGKTFPHVTSSSCFEPFGRLEFTATVISRTDGILNLTFSALHNRPECRFRVDIRGEPSPPGLGVGVLPEGLKLVSGDLVWEGYNNVERVSIQARVRGVMDGEWLVGGLALRVEGTWDNYSLAEGFGADALTIIVSNGSIIDVRK